LKPKISTIQGRFAVGSRWTVVHSYQLDLHTETERQVQVKEPLFNDACLSEVVDYKKSLFMRMEALDLTYNRLFFTPYIWGCQPTTYQYFQPLALEPLVLAVSAIHCALSEYASENKATMMVFQDEYRGTFCPSPVINFTLEATALINHTLVGRLNHPPPCGTTPLG